MVRFPLLPGLSRGRRSASPAGPRGLWALGQLVALGTALVTAGSLAPQAQASSGMGAIVRAFCLSAFENEMSQAGKTPPAGMDSYACSCVEERLRAGGTVDSARRDCREATARRYPI